MKEISKLAYRIINVLENNDSQKPVYLVGGNASGKTTVIKTLPEIMKDWKVRILDRGNYDDHIIGRVKTLRQVFELGYADVLDHMSRFVGNTDYKKIMNDFFEFVGAEYYDTLLDTEITTYKYRQLLNALHCLYDDLDEDVEKYLLVLDNFGISQYDDKRDDILYMFVDYLLTYVIDIKIQILITSVHNNEDMWLYDKHEMCYSEVIHIHPTETQNLFNTENIEEKIKPEINHTSNIVIVYSELNDNRDLKLDSKDFYFVSDNTTDKRYILGVLHRSNDILPKLQGIKGNCSLDEFVLLMDIGGPFFKNLGMKELGIIVDKMREFKIEDLVSKLVKSNARS